MGDPLLAVGGLGLPGPAQRREFCLGLLQPGGQGGEPGSGALQGGEAPAAVGEDLIAGGERLEGGLQALGLGPDGVIRTAGVIDPELLHPPLLLLLTV